MIKLKVVFLEGRLFSSQSELFKYFFNYSDWLEKPALQKSHFCFDHANRLSVHCAGTWSSNSQVGQIYAVCLCR